MPWKQWSPGDPVTINRIIWDGIESEFMADVLERDWFGPGHYASQLESALASFVGTKHAQLTNSGSSALLLGTQALQRARVWKRGDMILHPACTFPTSCNPIVQSGMIPVFVDVEEGTYNIDADQVDWAMKLHPDIKGAIIPHLLGNSPRMNEIMRLLGGRGLIEDCCDTLGSEYDGQKCGAFGNLSAFSFYGSHHITTAGVGGALLTNDGQIAGAVKSMAFWGRQFEETTDPYFNFCHRYTYETIGYDMQMSEIQAAFGVAQMQRLLAFIDGRKVQFNLMDDLMKQWQEWLVLPKAHPKADPSWFGYPVLIKESAPFSREQFARHLLGAKIEIRPLFAGNLTRHKAYSSVPYIVVGELKQSNRNMERALFLPAWGGMTEAVTAYLFETIERFMGQW